MNMISLSLQLFAIFLGISFGAGLYESRVVIPLWFTKKENGNYSVNFENLKTIDPGRKFWAFITTVPLTLLTIFNLILSFRSQGEIHWWWLSAAVLVLLERILTFSFFIPTIIHLQRGADLPEDLLSNKVTGWVRMNYLRNMATFIAWVLILTAITLL